MSEWKAEINGASVVLLGSFNPAIFQPEWFVRQNLLPEAEGAAAEIKVLAPQICDFQTGRYHIQSTTERFSVITKPDANPAPLKDLVLGTFFILEHTPLSAVGLNRFIHFAIKAEENWHRIGDKLAPKEGWSAILKGRPGLRSLSIFTDLSASDGPRLTVKIEPSVQVKQGVFFEINEHYQGPDTNSSNFLMEIVRNKWENSYNYAAEIADSILAWALR